MNENKSEQLRLNLICQLEKSHYLHSESVKQAFLHIPREVFVSKVLQAQAYRDTPLQIGEGQTISAPHMIALMCEALQINAGQKILEIGTGCGYHAAIVSQLVGPTGVVYTVERFSSLAQQAEQNLKKAHISNVHVVVGDGSLGLSDHAPYDRIYVTCAAPSIPPPLIDQLKNNGKLLIPVGSYVCMLTLLEKHDDNITTTEHGECVFVPLVGKYGH